MKLYDNDAYREEFMALVYDLLHSDGTNDRANQIIDAFDMAPAVEAQPLPPNAPLEAEKTGMLKTTWETPETCSHCMEHLSLEWSFCPECGRPTDWSENDPLTLKELREMDGEPVWVEFPKCTEATGWMLVSVNRHCVYDGLLGDCDFENCGKTWLAYRRRPGGGDTNA